MQEHDSDLRTLQADHPIVSEGGAASGKDERCSTSSSAGFQPGDRIWQGRALLNLLLLSRIPTRGPT